MAINMQELIKMALTDLIATNELSLQITDVSTNDAQPQHALALVLNAEMNTQPQIKAVLPTEQLDTLLTEYQQRAQEEYKKRGK